MNITTIRHQALTAKEQPLAFKNAEVLSKKDVEKAKAAQPTIKDPQELKWQQSVLLDAISNLENNMQTNNNHPLGRADYRPIESFEEAMNELSFINSDIFKSQALNAQANLRAQDIASLFSEN